MVSVVKYFRRNHFQKKLQKVKMKLSPDSSEHGWPDSGRTPPDSVNPAILARSDRISDRIPARFCRNLVRRHPATMAGCRWIPAPAVFWWLNSDACIIPVAGCCQISVLLVSDD